jgi:hypothetical protein
MELTQVQAGRRTIADTANTTVSKPESRAQFQSIIMIGERALVRLPGPRNSEKLFGGRMAINFAHTCDGSKDSPRFEPMERLKVYLFGATVLFASFGMGEAVDLAGVKRQLTRGLADSQSGTKRTRSGADLFGPRSPFKPLNLSLCDWFSLRRYFPHELKCHTVLARAQALDNLMHGASSGHSQDPNCEERRREWN